VGDSASFSIDPLAVINIADFISVNSCTVELVVFEASTVLVIWSDELADAMLDAISPLAVINIIHLGVAKRASAVSLVV
jgi:hypothetical protein